MERRHAVWVMSLLAIAMVIVLRLMGRVGWCEAGDLRPWSWDVWSRHNSQHLLDPYSLSHLQHGLGLYLLLTTTGRSRWSDASRLIIVAFVEATWEICENSRWLIERYRESTVSLNYFGDSIANSLADYASCLGGAFVAHRLRASWVIAVFVALELACLCWIRDSLILNAIMLIHPIERIRQWQLASEAISIFQVLAQLVGLAKLGKT